MNSRKARVFISCGQAESTDERGIADDIARVLIDLGFEPYVAFRVQSLRGLKENIFAQLNCAEYFLFVDYRREPIDGVGQFRGSLFSHQEFAIASFLDIDTISFQEKGVKREGILGIVQGNSIPFSDREHLPAIVTKRIKEAGWKSNWRRELLIRLPDRCFVDANRIERDAFNNVAQFGARFFHAKVENHDLRRPALNCYVYLERIRDMENDKLLPIPTIEFKWAGYILPNAIIGPKADRCFDAFWQQHTKASQAYFNCFADSTSYIPAPLSKGDYELTYRVTSENFPSVTQSFHLVIGEDIKSTMFELVHT